MVNVGAEMLKHYQKEKIMNTIMNMNIWNDFEMENLFIGMLITLFLAIIIAATAILVFKSQQKEDYPIKEDEGIVFLVVLLNIAQFFLIMPMLSYLKLFF